MKAVKPQNPVMLVYGASANDAHPCYDSLVLTRLPEVNPELAARLKALQTASGEHAVAMHTDDLERSIEELQSELERLQDEHIELDNLANSPDPNTALHSTYGDGDYDGNVGDL